MNPFLVVDSRMDGRRAYRAAQTKDFILKVLFILQVLSITKGMHVCCTNTILKASENMNP